MHGYTHALVDIRQRKEQRFSLSPLLFSAQNTFWHFGHVLPSSIRTAQSLESLAIDEETQIHKKWDPPHLCPIPSASTKLRRIQVDEGKDKPSIIRATLPLGLSKKQISSLWTRFHELDCDGRGEAKGFKGYLDEDDFGRVPKFDENPIAPRLVKVIFDDFGSNGKLTFPQFVNFMSTFGQTERAGGHDNHHHHHTTHASPPAVSSTKTDLENVTYSPHDSAKIRKIKFMFRVSVNPSHVSLLDDDDDDVVCQSNIDV